MRNSFIYPMVIFLFCVTGTMFMPVQTIAQQLSAGSDSDNTPANFVDVGQDGVVTYSPGFFRRYQPNTAFDVVSRVPGFTIDDGGDKRGFGGAAGNVLINGRRPSTKQDVPSAILGRISADLIAKVELIRVRVRDIDLLGQPEVVNVILLDDSPATFRWELYARENFLTGISPGASISLSDRWGQLEYNVGIDARYSVVGDPGEIRTFNVDDVLTEIRTDEDEQKGPSYNGYLNTSTWLGGTFFQLNTRAGVEDRDQYQVANRVSQLPGVLPRQEIIENRRRNDRFELGIDAERVLGTDLLGKAILLYSLLDQSPLASQQIINATGQQTRLQIQEDKTDSQETIARLEFDWAGFDNHAIQVDLELALNSLDNIQTLTDDTGAGPIIVDVPGGNVRVEETRWNFLVQDTWSLGNFDLDLGLGFERSTISQTGDAEQKRSFSFVKPRTVLTYSPVRGQQTRLLLERDVSQLDFNDFVSVVVFEDDNVNLGNPDLHPDSTWIAEFSHERRFARVGVVKLTAFHHWITDVLDLLPLTPTFDAPGNIGDGRRWGLILETTFPLDFISLDNAQLGLRGRWQDSTVVDPVTRRERVLSANGGFRGDVLFLGENKYSFGIDFRQDFEEARISWGWQVLERAKRPLYRANELDIFNESIQLQGFIETTRWFGLKMSLLGENLSNSIHKRDRTVYVNGRSISPVDRRELREGTNGARVTFRISGAF